MKTDRLNGVLSHAGRKQRSQQFQTRDKVQMEEQVRGGEGGGGWRPRRSRIRRRLFQEQIFQGIFSLFSGIYTKQVFRCSANTHICKHLNVQRFIICDTLRQNTDFKKNTWAHRTDPIYTLSNKYTVCAFLQL